MFTKEWMKFPLWETPNEGTPPAAKPSALSDADPTPADPVDSTPADSVDPEEKNPADPADPADPKDPADPAPEPITVESITLGEGLEVDEAVMTPFLEIMNDGELTRGELAQKLVNLQVSSAQASIDAAKEADQTLWDNTQNDWQKQLEKLPDIGGDNLDETLAGIKAGLKNAGGGEELFTALDITGAGNHPEIVKVLHTLTKNRIEGGPVSGNPAEGKLSQADKMFGST